MLWGGGGQKLSVWIGDGAPSTGAHSRIKCSFDLIVFCNDALHALRSVFVSLRNKEMFVLHQQQNLGQIVCQLLSTIQPRIQIFVNSCQFVGFGACVE